MMTGPVCINSTDVIGIVINSLTTEVTGSLFLSLFMIFLLLYVLALASGLPVEWTAIIMLPLILYLYACSGDFLQLAGFALIYLGFILAKYWFFNQR